MTGDDLERKGTRQDFDSGAGRTNEPVVTMQFTGQGADRFEEITRRLVERGRAKANRLGITDKNENDVANQQFAIVLDRVIKSAPTVDFDDNPSGISGQQRRDHHRRLDPGGEGPRDRPPLGNAAVQARHDRADEHLGDAREGLAPGGEAGGDRRPDRRRALPARLLPLPRRRRRPGPRDLRRLPLRRRAPAEQAGHDDAPRIRGPHPHDRSRGRRERGRLRTHQRRGPCGQIRTGRDLSRLLEGLPHDHRRERRDVRSRRSSCSSSRRPGSRASP